MEVDDVHDYSYGPALRGEGERRDLAGQPVFPASLHGSGRAAGLPVCRQHNRLARITAWNPNRRDDLPERVVTPPTEAGILDGMRAAVEIGSVVYAWELRRRPIPYDDRDALWQEFITYVSSKATDATHALADLGLTDGEIEAKMAALTA